MIPTVIGISGGTGAGKTFLANKIVETYSEENIAVINQDSYYKDLSNMPYEERIKQNFDHPDSIDIELFKYPNDIIDKLKKDPPDMIGLSNYSWNSNLSEFIASIAKKNNPDVITVQGGTNFPYDEYSQKKFLINIRN